MQQMPVACSVEGDSHVPSIGRFSALCVLCCILSHRSVITVGAPWLIYYEFTLSPCPRPLRPLPVYKSGFGVYGPGPIRSMLIIMSKWSDENVGEALDEIKMISKTEQRGRKVDEDVPAALTGEDAYGMGTDVKKG